MSRSRRKTQIIGYSGSGVSERSDKKRWHSAMRARERDELSKIKSGYSDADNHITKIKDDIISSWDMVKDGKGYFGRMEDREFYRKYMRK